MFSVTIKGFKTLEQAQTFYDWYESQGEQAAIDWFGYRMSENPDLGMRYALTDVTKDPEISNNNLSFYVHIYE